MRQTLEQLQARLERLYERRDQLILMLSNNRIDIHATRQAINRKLKQIEKRHNATASAMRDGPPPAMTLYTPPPAEPDLTIPDFLRRDRAEDAAVRAAIEAEVAERKRTKAQVRIEKLKAKQSGETRKLPLMGRAALKFIKEKQS